MTALVDVGAALAAHEDACGCVMCEAYSLGYQAGQEEERRAHEETAVAGWLCAMESRFAHLCEAARTAAAYGNQDRRRECVAESLPLLEWLERSRP